MRKNAKLLIFILKAIHGYSKTFLPVSLFIALVQGVSPLVNIIVPKLIIDELLGAQDIHRLIRLVALLAGINLLLKLIETVLTRNRTIDMDYVQLKVEQNLANKCLNLAYEDIEKKSVLDLKERALQGIYNFYELVNLIGTAAKSLISLKIGRASCRERV